MHNRFTIHDSRKLKRLKKLAISHFTGKKGPITIRENTLYHPHVWGWTNNDILKDTAYEAPFYHLHFNLLFSSSQMRFSSTYFLRMDKLKKTKDEGANLESHSFKYKNQKQNISIREKTAHDLEDS